MASQRELSPSRPFPGELGIASLTLGPDCRLTTARTHSYRLRTHDELSSDPAVSALMSSSKFELRSANIDPSTLAAILARPYSEYETAHQTSVQKQNSTAAELQNRAYNDW